MALDFSNRNPQDPNGIFSLDTTGAIEAWVKDGDWSQVYLSAGDARKAGANNKVRLGTAITNDGRKFDVIIGADGKPISEVGDSKGQDDDRARAWAQTAPKPLPPGAQPTRNTNGRVMGYNPQTGLYDIDQGEVPVTSTTKEWRSEGTPDGQGGFDNSRPIMAAYVNGRRTGETRAPTADELKDWNEAGQRSRNPGGQSDAEVAAQQEKDRQAQRQTEANQRANEAAARSARTEERNAETAASNARRAEAQEARAGRAEDRAEAAANRHQMPDGSWLERGSDGVWRPMRTEGTGDDPLPASIPPYQPNFEDPARDFGIGARRAQLQAAVSAGTITPAQAAAEIKANREQAQVAATNRGIDVRIQEGNRAAEQTERGRLTTEAGQRANLASSLFGGASRNAAAAKILPGSGGAVADAFLAEIGLGQHTAQSMGGMNYPGQWNPNAYPLLQPPGAPAASTGVVPPPAQAQAGGGVTINIGGGNPPTVSEAAQAAGHPYSTSPAPYPSDWFKPTGQQPAAAGVVNPAAAPMDLSAGLKSDGIVEDLASLGFDMSDLAL